MKRNEDSIQIGLDSVQLNTIRGEQDSLYLKTVETIAINPYIERIKYNPRTDDGIAFILLLCFLFTSLLIRSNRKYIVQRVKDFFYNKERGSFFSEGYTSKSGLLVYFYIQTILFISLYFVNFFCDLHIDFITYKNSLLILGIYSLIIGVYFGLKHIVYRFIGVIFMESAPYNIWIQSYNTLIIFCGIFLFPFLLFIIYFDLDFHSVFIFGLVLLSFFKILLFYKWINLILINKYDLVRLFLYFCALEILPCLVIYQILIQVNNHIIKL